MLAYCSMSPEVIGPNAWPVSMHVVLTDMVTVIPSVCLYDIPKNGICKVPLLDALALFHSQHVSCCSFMALQKPHIGVSISFSATYILGNVGGACVTRCGFSGAERWCHSL